ncbi:MAG: potassium/proton antiporter [Paludibacteraceae bacterium]|nr:potassium/proton antiporter [Paludibacteraceae bacterium]
MTLTPENIVFMGAILVFASIFISKWGYRFGIPTLLLFLFTGMLFGVDGLGLEFDSHENAQLIGMLSLSVILFSGGMDTKYHDIKPILPQGLVLSTIGVMLTTGITGLFIYLISEWTSLDIGLSLPLSMLLAATVSSTDSASVFNLLRSQSIGLKYNLRPTLELESGSNDPMAYVLTIALVQAIVSADQFSGLGLAIEILIQLAVGGVLGYVLGHASVWIVNHINLPNSSLYSVLVLSMIFIIFTLTDQLKGNGYLAVYVAGLVAGNNRLLYKREMNSFMQGVTWLLQIVMFITLGLLVNPHEMWGVLPVAIAIGLFMMFVSRPAAVFLCLAPFKMPAKAKLFLSWVGLRGAVPIIFATYPVIAGIENAYFLFNVVFVITLLSLLLQGTTITMCANWLGLSTVEPKDGNDFGIELPEKLESQLSEIILTEETLANGNRLSDMKFPDGMLVMMVKRGNSFIVPNGKLELQIGDKLLTIARQKG